MRQLTDVPVIVLLVIAAFAFGDQLRYGRPPR